MSQIIKGASGGGGAGTVTSVSFVNANGFTGTVANPTTTPALTLTGGAATSPGYASGYYYYINPFGTVGTTASGLTANLIYVFPFNISKTTTFQNISLNVTIAGANLRLGLYNFPSGLPTTVNQTLGTLDVSGTGVKTLPVTLSLSAGWYGFALQCDTNTTFSGVLNTLSRGNILTLGTTYSGTSSDPGMLSFTGAYSGGLIDLSASTPTIVFNQILVGFQAS